MKKILCAAAADTRAAGEALAQNLSPNAVVALCGEMGAGKTEFVRGMARVLSPEAAVSSPTFALVNEYAGNPPFFHWDAMRLTGYDDLLSTGFFDQLGLGIFAVEWAENIGPWLPEDRITVRFTVGDDGTRNINITGKDF